MPQFILLITLLSSILPPPPLKPVEPVVTLEALNASVNAPISVPIFFQGIDSLSITSYQFSLSYDPSFLAIDTISTQGTVSESSLISVNMDTPGILHVAAAHNHPLPPSGTLMELRISTQSRPGIVPIHIDSFIFNEGELDVEVVDGFIDITPLESQSTLSADTLFVRTNQVIDLPIFLSPGADSIYSGSFSIQYDPDLLNAVDISRGSTLLEIQDAIVDYSVPTPGLIRIIFASSSPLPKSDNPLLRLLLESTEQSGEKPYFFYRGIHK